MHHKQISLSNFARNHRMVSPCFRPESTRQLAALSEELAEASFLVRGRGLSYNDSPLLQTGYTILSERLNHFLAFDAQSGIVVCQAGLKLRDLFDLHEDWMPAVVPGTVHASIGGCLSHDIHGKNHHQAGSFAAQVLWFDLIIGKQQIRVSPKEEPDLWRATVGGAGLVGSIATVALQLQRKTRGLQVTTQPFDRHAELIAEMQQHGLQQDYQVAWLDLLHGQRSILSYARHSAERVTTTPHQGHTLPPLPFSILSRTAVKVFNSLYYHWPRKTISLSEFMHFNNPLDQVSHWQGVYGKRGLKQFQCLFSAPQAVSSLREIQNIMTEYQALPCLAVLKYFKGSSQGYLSFAEEGFTLAVDFKNTAQSTQAIRALNTYIAEQGGKVYLAKDTELTPELFQRMYPAYKELMAVRAHYHSPMQSVMGQRLGIHP
ncbi:MAG: FAD-binding oxidoreductase [Legionellaceae bacterium]|nr:FAD-binding oxidoreductase [Legionellaceae bacterium]